MSLNNMQKLGTSTVLAMTYFNLVIKLYYIYIIFLLNSADFVLTSVPDLGSYSSDLLI